MNLELTPAALWERLAEMPTADAVDGQPLFDPGQPLPLWQATLPELPRFCDLLNMVPESYAREMERAYVVMVHFSTLFWPALARVVDAEPTFEWMMHGDLLKPWYRDHLVHQVRVTAIGDLLLREQWGPASLLEQAHAVLAGRGLIPPKIKNPQEFVRLAWWLAALFHDCGYPLQFHEGHWGTLKDSYHVRLGRRPGAGPPSLIRRMKNDLDGLASPASMSSRRAAHGFVGGAELLSGEYGYEDEVPGEDSECRARRGALLRLAASAVLMHHPQPAPGTNTVAGVAFEEHPLAWLLILSDEIDEAERVGTEVSVPTGHSHANVSPVTLPVESISIATDAAGSRLTLEFKLTKGTRTLRGLSPDAWARKKQQTLHENLRVGPGQLLEEIEVSAK